MEPSEFRHTRMADAEFVGYRRSTLIVRSMFHTLANSSVWMRRKWDLKGCVDTVPALLEVWRMAVRISTAGDKFHQVAVRWDDEIAGGSWRTEENCVFRKPCQDEKSVSLTLHPPRVPRSQSLSFSPPASFRTQWSERDLC